MASSVIHNFMYKVSRGQVHVWILVSRTLNHPIHLYNVHTKQCWQMCTLGCCQTVHFRHLAKGQWYSQGRHRDLTITRPFKTSMQLKALGVMCAHKTVWLRCRFRQPTTHGGSSTEWMWIHISNIGWEFMISIIKFVQTCAGDMQQGNCIIILIYYRYNVYTDVQNTCSQFDTLIYSWRTVKGYTLQSEWRSLQTTMPWYCYQLRIFLISEVLSHNTYVISLTY